MSVSFLYSTRGSRRAFTQSPQRIKGYYKVIDDKKLPILFGASDIFKLL
ncbi:hypothetical protein [Pradoshia eiseniae]|nr:hypothetical protein [Pradoshia eiseniae]